MSAKQTNSNTEPDREEIIKMLKFYFSNANYSKDKFLREECEKPISETDSNPRGIAINTLLIFNKLKQLNANKEILLELIKSEESLKKIIQIRTEGENTCLLKKDMENYKEYIEKIKQDPDAFIIRLSGVHGGLRDVQQYLSQFMDPLLIRLRKDKKGKFTGSCFVELPSLEQVDEVLKMKIPLMVANHDEEKDVKRQKVENSDLMFMEITKKTDWMNRPALSEEEKQRQILLQKYKGKFYFFESADFIKNTDGTKKEEKSDEEKKELKIKIQELKKKVGCQFVDLSKNVLRFRNVQNFETKEVEGVKLTKLNCDEEKEYVANIPVNSNNTGKKQKRS